MSKKAESRWEVKIVREPLDEATIYVWARSAGYPESLVSLLEQFSTSGRAALCVGTVSSVACTPCSATFRVGPSDSLSTSCRTSMT